MMNLQTSKHWPLLRDIFASEILHGSLDAEMDRLQAMESRTDDEEQRLRDILFSKDNDIEVMAQRVDYLKENGLDFYGNPEVQVVREGFMQEYLDSHTDMVEQATIELHEALSQASSVVEAKSVLDSFDQLQQEKDRITSIATDVCLWVQKQDQITNIVRG
jgi:hypothetical protein